MVLLLGLTFLTLGLVIWRGVHEWIIGREVFRERVYSWAAADHASG